MQKKRYEQIIEYSQTPWIDRSLRVASSSLPTALDAPDARHLRDLHALPGPKSLPLTDVLVGPESMRESLCKRQHERRVGRLLGRFGSTQGVTIAHIWLPFFVRRGCGPGLRLNAWNRWARRQVSCSPSLTS